jgi:prepilin-type N-terminal cleavage/methylation domain-containing protein
MICMIGANIPSRFVIAWLRGSARITTRPRTAQLRNGFSVVELLVVVTIFAVGSLAIASTYINFTRLHRRIANTETLGQELRFASELVVRAIRNNAPEYPPLPGALELPMHEIRLKSQNGNSSIWIQRFLAAEPPCTGLNADCLALSLDQGASWAPMTGKNVHIHTFDVYVTPTKNPFESTGVGSFDNDQQPVTTVLIGASFRTAHASEAASLSVQTSVSSRLYLR